jgi:hypothetical protein
VLVERAVPAGGYRQLGFFFLASSVFRGIDISVNSTARQLEDRRPFCMCDDVLLHVSVAHQ